MTLSLEHLPRRLRSRAPLGDYQGNRLLTNYVAFVVGLGAALLILQGGLRSLISWDFLLWFVFCLASELLWLETPRREATDSMSSTFNVVVLYLFGNGLSLWIIGLSVLFATRFIQRRDWTRTAFGLGQMVITAFLAGTVFEELAGGPGRIELFESFRGLAALALCCVAYFLVNTFLVAGAVALEKQTGLWTTWRTNWAFRNGITSSAALFALSPILLLSCLSIGYPGVLLFFLPLVIIKNQNRNYIQLIEANKALIASERMAAKGEMAAQIAHEMNNYLAVLSGRIELIKRKLVKLDLSELLKDAEIIWTQIGRLKTQADGLMKFSNTEVAFAPFDLNALCQKDVVEVLQPQNDFDDLRFEVDLDPGLGEVIGDSGQIHQILVNLCRNAAQAMRDAQTPDRMIRIRTRMDAKGYVRFEVEDNGPGVPATLRARIFEPGFTTKKDGHGFGLATCLRIMEAHKGRLSVDDRPGGGAHFVAAWPHKRLAERGAKAA